MTRESRDIIPEFYNSLTQQGMDDLKEVLLNVYRKLDRQKEDQPLINRLVNYIYFCGVTDKLNFTAKQNELIRELAKIGQAAGLNGVYRSSYGDKSQF